MEFILIAPKVAFIISMILAIFRILLISVHAGVYGKIYTIKHSFVIPFLTGEIGILDNAKNLLFGKSLFGTVLDCAFLCLSLTTLSFVAFLLFAIPNAILFLSPFLFCGVVFGVALLRRIHKLKRQNFAETLKKTNKTPLFEVIE